MLSSNVQTRDLHDLFTLGADIEGGTETGDLFADVTDELLKDEPGYEPRSSTRLASGG